MLTVRCDSCIYILGEINFRLSLSFLFLYNLAFLVVAIVIVFYYAAVTVVINGSGSVTLDSFR